MFVVVSYDVTDDTRRRRIASELENFGTRAQYSVFECHLDESDLDELKRRLEALAAADEDHVRYYHLCPKDEGRIVSHGPGAVTRDDDYVIV